MTDDQEGDAGGRRADDVSWPLVEHRLTSLENSFHAEFQKLDQKLDAMGNHFVGRDVYDADRRTAKVEHAAMHDDIRDARRLAWWAISGIGLSLVGLVMAAIGRLAGLS